MVQVNLHFKRGKSGESTSMYFFSIKLRVAQIEEGSRSTNCDARNRTIGSKESRIACDRTFLKKNEVRRDPDE